MRTYTIVLVRMRTLHNCVGTLCGSLGARFGVGSIYNQGPRSLQFRVESINELSTIINHFDKYPLITQKQADYLLFREVFLMIQRKEHLTPGGLDKIVAIKASINRGLSEELKAAFPNTGLAPRPVIKNQKISDPY